MAERNSDLSQITANAQNIPDDSVDCGIRALGWCRGPSCQKFARLRTFIIILAIAGLLQGACESYFRVSAKQAALEYHYNPLLVDWLLVTSGLVQAVFALGFAYWAHKLHPVSWLGGSIMLQSAACIIAIIPLIWNFTQNDAPTTLTLVDELCPSPETLKVSFARLQMERALTPEQSKNLILAMLFVLQFGLGLGALAFYTIGIIYIDDNSQSVDSPAAIATALGAKTFGLQAGTGLVLAIGGVEFGWWLGWAILAPAVFLSGLLLSLYPKRLPKTVIHQAAQRIIEESHNRNFGSQYSTYIDDTAFGPTVKRIFSNKLLMFNLVSIMFIQAAVINFEYQEESYLQSRYYLPFSENDGLLEEWRVHLMSYWFRPPVAAVAMLIAGLVISKLKLSGRKITGINIGMGVHLVAIYVIYIYLKCDVGPIAGFRGGKLEQPFCSATCAHVCQPTSFMPICPENTMTTYFAPCYAGCKNKTVTNNIVLYKGCTCSVDSEQTTNTQATSGACSSEKCAKMLIMFQVSSLTAAALLGVTVIGKIIITLRAVLPQDKAVALAMGLMFLGFFAYVPVHLSYDVVSRTTCIYWAPHYEKCLLRETPKHGDILDILTASLILVGVLFDILVFIYVEGLNLYNCKVTDLNYTPSLYAPIPHEDSTSPVSNPMTIETAIDDSPASTVHAAKPVKQQREGQPLRPAPKPAINVYRNPSSVTSSSTGENSIEPGTNGVTYAQVVFPPDKRKPNDGSSSPKRLAVRADVPLHQLSAQDVRTQLHNLKSFSREGEEIDTATTVETLLTVDTKVVTTNALIETNLDDPRPKSPETDF